MEKYSWLKWYHGAVSDDKWPLVARRTGQSIAVVVAVWAALLECASQAEERGSVADFDAESMDALLQVEDGACQAVVDALTGGKRPRIVEGRIVNWEKRQSDEAVTERKRLQREREKLENERLALEQIRSDMSQKAEENQTKSQNVTPMSQPCHAPSRDVTPCPEMSRRGEEIREDKKENTYSAKIDCGTEVAPCPPISASASLDAEHEHTSDDAPLVGTKKKLSGRRKDGFERFWEDFEDKRGKAEAIDAWAQIPQFTDALIEQICAAARKYATERADLRARKGTPKMAQGWLTGRRWEDEPGERGRHSASCRVPARDSPLPPLPTPEELERKRLEGMKRMAEWRERQTRTMGTGPIPAHFEGVVGFAEGMAQ